MKRLIIFIYFSGGKKSRWSDDKGPSVVDQREKPADKANGGGGIDLRAKLSRTNRRAEEKQKRIDQAKEQIVSFVIHSTYLISTSRQNKKNFVNDNNRNDSVIVGAVVTAGVVAAAVNEIKVAVVVKVDIIMETKAVGEMIRWAGIMVIYDLSQLFDNTILGGMMNQGGPMGMNQQMMGGMGMNPMAMMMQMQQMMASFMQQNQNNQDSYHI